MLPARFPTMNYWYP